MCNINVIHTPMTPKMKATLPEIDMASELTVSTASASASEGRTSHRRNQTFSLPPMTDNDHLKLKEYLTSTEEVRFNNFKGFLVDQRILND